MLESFTCETFQPHMGDTFRLHLDAPPPLDVVLTEASELPVSSPQRPRAPFSIVFRGPPTVVLPQRIYAVEHPGIGTFELFLVPIGSDDEGVRYEAVFT